MSRHDFAVLQNSHPRGTCQDSSRVLKLLTGRSQFGCRRASSSRVIPFHCFCHSLTSKPVCRSIRDLCKQSENQQRIRDEIHHASQKSVLCWEDASTYFRNRLFADFPVLHTCMQAARRITRQKSSTQTLSHDQSWRSSRLKRIDFNEKNHIAIIDISDLDALGIFLGQFESPSVIAGKKIESDSGTARQWQHITKAQLLDWIATEEVKMDFKNIDDVRRVADPRSNVKTLYAVAAKSVWEEGRVSLPRLKPFLREKWFSHMALERTDVSAPSTNVVPLFESLLLDLSNVDLRAMSFLTPQNITDLARTCGGTWTSLNLSGHERLQTEDIISIIRQTPKLRLLSLGSNDSLDLDLAEILQVAGNRCRIEHRGLYQTYFNEGTCEAHFAKPLIGQIVVAETDDSVVRFLIAPAADEHLFFLQCGRGLKRLRREFTRKHPASHIHALAMIENGFALEVSKPVLSPSDY